MNCVKLDDKGSTKSDRIVRTKLSTPNNRAPARYVRVQRTEPANFHQLANTHIHDVRVPRTRSKLHGKGNRGTARIVVELPSRNHSSDGFPHGFNHLFSFFFLLPLEIPTLDPFIFFPSAPLRTASPVSEPARTTLPISGYYYLTRNQGKSTEPTDKRRHESVTTRTRRYDTAATIENLRGGVSREGGGHVHPRDDDDGKSTSVETKARR